MERNSLDYHLNKAIAKIDGITPEEVTVEYISRQRQSRCNLTREYLELEREADRFFTTINPKLY